MKQKIYAEMLRTRPEEREDGKTPRPANYPVEVEFLSDGVRVVVGTPTSLKDEPNLLIERSDHGVQVFVHPDDGDAVCVVKISSGGKVTIENDRGDLLATIGGA